VLPDVDSIPFVIGVDEGHFEDAGVDVVIEKFSSPVNRDTALQAGRLDAVVSDLLAAAFAVNGGFPVKAVSMTEGSYKLLAAAGTEAAKAVSGGSTVKEVLETLRGQTVGISKNTIIEYCTDRFMQNAGLPADHIRKEAIPQIPLRREMLRSGTLAAATLPEPLASSAAADGAVVIGDSTRLGINPGVIIFSEEYLRAHPEAVKAFYAGYDRTAAEIGLRGIGEHTAYLMESFGFPDSSAGLIRSLEYHPAQPPPESEVEQVVRWLEERNLVKVGLTYPDLVNADFVGRP